MALYDDPKKKKPEYAPGLLPGAQLIPGTMAAKVADAVGGFKANYQATQDRTGEYMRQQAAIARPDFGNVQGGIKTLQAPIVPRPQAQAQVSTQSPGTQPRNAAELDQASKAETAARNQAPPPGASAGAGASTTAGVGAPINKSVGKFGETVFSNVGSQYGTPATAGTMGTVNTQNFGNPVVPQGPGAIARPGVASTYGLGVNDPRMNDAIARPQVQLGPNQTNGFGTLRGPDQMAEQYNSREDREARQAVSGNIDTALMMARGKADSGQVIGNLLETQARLNSGAEGLSQEAVQGRANRDNQFGIADLNNAGENNRAGIQADVARGAQQVTREGQQLDFQASQIARPTLERLADGTLAQITGTSSAPVLGPDGKPVQGQVQAQGGQGDYAAKQLDAYTNLLNGMRDMNGALPADAAQQAAALLAAAPGSQASAAPPAAPTLDAYVKAARAAGYKQSDAELAAAFQKKYPQAK